jgi:hypothetical protein
MRHLLDILFDSQITVVGEGIQGWTRGSAVTRICRDKFMVMHCGREEGGCLNRALYSCLAALAQWDTQISNSAPEHSKAPSRQHVFDLVGGHA